MNKSKDQSVHFHPNIAPISWTNPVEKGLAKQTIQRKEYTSTPFEQRIQMEAATYAQNFLGKLRNPYLLDNESWLVSNI